MISAQITKGTRGGRQTQRENLEKMFKLKLQQCKVNIRNFRDFLGGPVVETLSSNAGNVGSVPDQGTKIPYTSWPKKQNIKQKQYCNTFNNDFKKERKKFQDRLHKGCNI